MKTWERPLLVILARTRNEVVLSYCKNAEDVGVGAATVKGTPAAFYGACMFQLSANSAPSCGACQAADAS